jgi:hypothetical protein
LKSSASAAKKRSRSGPMSSGDGPSASRRPASRILATPRPASSMRSREKTIGWR